MKTLPMQAQQLRIPHRSWFRGPAGRRIMRFALTGGTAGLTQLALLKLFVDGGWPELGANAVAFLLAAQLNFILSCTFTWRDRRANRSLARCWLAFHGSIAGMAVVNMVVFAAARTVAPAMLASIAGILAAAAGNFMLGDRLIFRSRPLAEPARSQQHSIASAA